MTADRMPLTELLEKAGDGDLLRAVADSVLQILMETDVEEVIGARRRERSAERLNWRKWLSRKNPLPVLAHSIWKSQSSGRELLPSLPPRTTSPKLCRYLDSRQPKSRCSKGYRSSLHLLSTAGLEHCERVGKPLCQRLWMMVKVTGRIAKIL